MQEPDLDPVSAANQRFYEAVAPNYDAIDPRRDSQQDHRWLDRILTDLHKSQSELSDAPLTFLDAGAGTGFLAKRAQAYFDRVIAVDISNEMLKQISDPRVETVCSSVYEIPLPSDSVDVIGCFATLHHLQNPADFFREAYRLLHDDGVFYSDHDIEANFVRRFRLPLKLYRSYFDHGHEYLSSSAQATEADYNLSEFHGDSGLDVRRLGQALKDIGFHEVTMTVHWEGMGAFGTLSRLAPAALTRNISWSPILRLIARK